MLNIFKSPKKQDPHPIVKSIDSNDPLIKKIQQHLTSEEQQLFIQSFYTYTNYHSENDFVVDLDSIWQWLGYAQKVKAKELLEKHFTKDVDYKVNFSRSGKNKIGRNKNQYVMNVKTFKKFCIKADTKKADKIHDYYIKMEGVLQEHAREQFQLQSEQFKEQQHLLEAKEQELLKYKEKTYEEIEKSGHVYVVLTDGGVKVGKTKDDVSKRMKGLQTGNVNNIEIILDFHTSNADLLERVAHYILDRYRCNSNREFFDCDIEYIKQVVTTLGTVIDTLKSTYQSIKHEELVEKLNVKLGTNIQTDVLIEELNNPPEEETPFTTWLRDHLVYSNHLDDYVELKTITESFTGNPNLPSRFASKYKLEVENFIKHNFGNNNINHEYKQLWMSGDKVRGWQFFKLKG